MAKAPRAPSKVAKKKSAEPSPDWLTGVHLDPLRTGAMRITGFTSATGESLVIEAIALHRLSVVRELYAIGPGAPKKAADGYIESRTLVPYERIFDRASDRTSVLRVKSKVKRGETLTLDVLGRRVAVEMSAPTKSPVGTKLPSAKKLEALSPARVLLIRLCDAMPRDVLFSPTGELRKRARLDAAAELAFRFDEWECPSIDEPLSASPDVLAMANALAAKKPLTRLSGTPSSTWAHTLDRVVLDVGDRPDAWTGEIYVE